MGLDIIAELKTAFYSMEVTPLSAAIKLGISFLLGATVGFERQTRRQSVGMRTITIICMASTAAMLLSVWIPQSYPHFLNGDPGRIAAQILTGIGFLGAGAIIQSKGSVHGLTTAATIWMIAITGMIVGAGMYIEALILVFLTLFVLVTLERLEKRRMLTGDVKMLVLECNGDFRNIDQIKSIIHAHGVFVYGISVVKNYEKNTSRFEIKVQVNSQKTYDPMFDMIRKECDIHSISLISM